MKTQINELLEIMHNDLEELEYMDADPMTREIIRNDIQWEILRLESQLDMINQKKKKMKTLIVLFTALVVVTGALFLAIYLIKKLD